MYVQFKQAVYRESTPEPRPLVAEEVITPLWLCTMVIQLLFLSRSLLVKHSAIQPANITLIEKY